MLIFKSGHDNLSETSRFSDQKSIKHFKFLTFAILAAVLIYNNRIYRSGETGYAKQEIFPQIMYHAASLTIAFLLAITFLPLLSTTFRVTSVPALKP